MTSLKKILISPQELEHLINAAVKTALSNASIGSVALADDSVGGGSAAGNRVAGESVAGGNAVDDSVAGGSAVGESVAGEISAPSTDNLEDFAGRKRRTSNHEGEPEKKKPLLEVPPYSELNDVDWSNANSVGRYLESIIPVLTEGETVHEPLLRTPSPSLTSIYRDYHRTHSPGETMNVDEPLLRTPSPTLTSIYRDYHRTHSPGETMNVDEPPSPRLESILATSRAHSPTLDSIFQAPRAPSPLLAPGAHSPAPSSLGYTLPPTNYVTPDNSFEDQPLHSTPIPSVRTSSPAPSSSNISVTFEEEEGQQVLSEQGSHQLFDELFGRDGEEGGQDRDGEEGGQDRDVGRDRGQDRDVGRDRGEDRDAEEEIDRDGHEEDYADIFMKQNEDSNRKAIPDHEALRLLIRNQTYLRREDRIPPSKFSPFMIEFSSHMLTLQRSTMAAIEGNIKSHKELSTGLMMCLFSKFTGLEFLDSTERKKKNWLNIGIKNFTERVLGKSLK